MLILLGASSLLAACGRSGSANLGVAEQRKLVDRYCVACHSAAKQAGGLVLEQADLDHVARDAQMWEKVIRTLRAGTMPPPGEPRPDFATGQRLRTSLEGAIDSTAERVAGTRSFQRLNRAEYARAIRDLLDLDVDVDALLPPDAQSTGFDNIAEAQAFSPAVMEDYLRAADKVAALALGEPDAKPTSATYAVSSATSQMHPVDGAPAGTRGGVSVVHDFPADGEYTFTVRLQAATNGGLIGRRAADEQIEISIDGERVALLSVDPRIAESREGGLDIKTPRIFVKAGPQRVSAAFLQRFSALVDDLVAPVEYTPTDSIGPAQLLQLPRLQHLNVTGPFDATGVSDTPSRRRVFHCRPVKPEEQEPCARSILSELGERAYRRPLEEDEVDALLKFYWAPRETGDFEAGIHLALRAILASPQFVFRLEPRPESAVAGEDYRLGDYELASRLSFFLWSSLPDQELLDSARDGLLHSQDELERQVKRMLDDPRAEALSTRFAAQWLQLARLDTLVPDALLYPNYDKTLASAMRRETELLFDSVVRDDESVLVLLTADYTFVDERLAAHYGIPGVLGNRFRRVVIDDERRHGLLGHASILTLTSRTDRTSPVVRGKWVLETLLGSAPPAPPANVPPLEKMDAVKDGRVLSGRERLESHRADPACASCHKLIDPIGLALESYDVTGAWRIKDGGEPIDARATLFDGTTVAGPEDLRAALLRYSDAFIATFTENLMTYALGRRLEYSDMPTVRDIDRDAAAADNKFSAFVLGIVESVTFQMNRAETAVVAQR
jgi:Protein of unknown function (DUF1592)/Protein of unknown function (DUF1588)/Protein of unknown function (DUF1595)/Protein of unknown function (DUF1585)/Protein of unknown function (DUF1587)/Planctomycete cytochrome C